MNKIRVIDLLNKIANGEEVPKKIKYDDNIYEYVRMWEQYVHEASETPLLKEISAYNYSGLNNEVEILEEEKKIPEKLSTWFSVEAKQSKELNIEYANTNFENMYEKINEIIDYLKSKGDK